MGQGWSIFDSMALNSLRITALSFLKNLLRHLGLVISKMTGFCKSKTNATCGIFRRIDGFFFLSLLYTGGGDAFPHYLALPPYFFGQK